MKFTVEEGVGPRSLIIRFSEAQPPVQRGIFAISSEFS